MFLGNARRNGQMGRPRDRALLGRARGRAVLGRLGGDDDFGAVDTSAQLVADPLQVAVDQATQQQSVSPMAVADVQDFGGSVFDPGGAVSPATVSQPPVIANTTIATPSATSDVSFFDQLTKLITGTAPTVIKALQKQPAAPAIAPRPAAAAAAPGGVVTQLTKYAPYIAGGLLLMKVLGGAR